MNSRNKGKVGEREACQALAEHLGIEASRSVQYCGRAGDADLNTALTGVHFEVKRKERFSVYDAVEQAQSECGGKVPVVLHRRNRGEWLAIVPLSELRRLADEVSALPQPRQS